MFIDDLRKSILQKAIQGKLVEQNSNDEPASELLKRIREEKKKLIKDGKIKKEKPLTPITDKEKPFCIPESWEWVRLGEIEEINLGFTYKPEYTEGGVHFLSVKDISGGKIDFSNTQFVSQETYDNAPYGSKPKKGDILFGRVGTMGKPQILNVDEKFCIFVSLGFLRDHSGILNKEYICHWMNSFLFRDQVNYWVKGAAVKNLNTTWLAKFLVPIPPLEEQKRIVAKLDELMPLLDEAKPLEEKIMTLEKEFPGKLRQSILQYAIQGKLVPQNNSDEPASELLKRIREEKEKLIKYGKIKNEKPLAPITDEEKLFDIPSNWEWVKLGDIFNITMGQSPEGTSIGENVEGMEFHQGKIYFSDKIIKSSGIKTNQVTKIANPNSILLCMRAPVGKVNITDREICIGRGLSALSPFDGISLDYSFYVLQTLEAQFINKATGSTFKAITGDVVKEQVFPLPPLEEQKRIADKLDELMKLCDELEEQIN